MANKGGKLIVLPGSRPAASQVGIGITRAIMVELPEGAELIAKQLNGIEVKPLAVMPPKSFLVLLDEENGERMRAMLNPKPLAPDGELRPS